MKILELYRDHSVHYKTEGHKHTRPGWVNVPCPFCTGNPGYHLGARLDGSQFVCWRCGGKAPKKAIAGILKIEENEAVQIIRQYGGVSKAKEVKRKPRAKSLKKPTGVGPLGKRHRKYLERRGYDPDILESIWDLEGTGPLSKLDNISYKHRIYTPIYWDGKEVSFQTRDITEKHQAKYMACPEAREVIPHKSILYGKQEAWGDVGIAVEGITDVWRLGTNAFATFGIKFTPKQVRAMAKQFSRVIILFDPDPQAIKQAKILENELAFRGVEVVNEFIETDPGDMTEEEAISLVRRFF